MLQSLQELTGTSSYARLFAACAASLWLTACAGDTNLARDAAVGAGVGAVRRQGPDFVAQTRRDNPDYLPVGVAAPPRAIAAKPQPGVKAAEADMDSIRAQNEARADAARRAAAATPAAEPPARRP